MQKFYNDNFDLNKFLSDIKLKKQYLNNLKAKMSLVFKIRDNNYKFLYSFIQNSKIDLIKNDNLVVYIIDISFSRSNTFLNVMDFSGKSKFFYSAGSFNYSGKNKRSRYLIFKQIYRILVFKLNFLRGKPIALHLKNVGHHKIWIVEKLKKKFFIKCIKNFNLYPHNGCRKKKIRRKKFKKRRNG